MRLEQRGAASGIYVRDTLQSAGGGSSKGEKRGLANRQCDQSFLPRTIASSVVAEMMGSESNPHPLPMGALC